MGIHTTVPTVTKVTCDKLDCEDHIAPVNEISAYGREVDALLRRYNWSVWTSRGRRYYCPEHGPGKGSKMRKVL